MRISTKITILFSLLLVLTTGNASGNPVEVAVVMTDSVCQVKLSFPVGSSAVDPNFMDNANSLKELNRLMANKESGLNTVFIAASSSPDGLQASNRALAERRANALKSYILEQFPHVADSMISVNADYMYWDGLIELVRRDPNVPASRELLEMLSDLNLSDDAKSFRMKTLNGGKTFAYLRDNLILDRLRWVSATIKFQPSLSQPISDSDLELDPEPAPILDPEPVFEPEIFVAGYRYDAVYPVALKTNLLLDVLGGPNIGVEVPIGNRFSVAGSFAYAHTRINNRFALQTIQGSAEGRYWFRQRDNVLTGWNVGVYGTYSGHFDIQWNSGRQGDDFWSFGLSGGYAIPISDRFNIGFSVMGGFLHSSEVRYYNKPQEGHLIWKETKYNVSRFRITQIRVDFVWLLKSNKKRAK